MLGEPDNGYGVSGDPIATTDSLGTVNVGYANLNNGRAKVINNNKTPFGRLRRLPLEQQDQLRHPTTQVFSFHGTGANVLFMDGHVTFLRDNIDAIVMCRL